MNDTECFTASSWYSLFTLDKSCSDLKAQSEKFFFKNLFLRDSFLRNSQFGLTHVRRIYSFARRIFL